MPVRRHHVAGVQPALARGAGFHGQRVIFRFDVSNNSSRS